jgi:hypothetical protein
MPSCLKCGQPAPAPAKLCPACGEPASTPSPGPVPSWPGHEEAASDDPFAGLNAERGYDPVSRYMTDKPLAIHDDPDEDEQEPDNRPGRRRRRVGMIAAGVVVAVAAGAVAGWTALHHHGGPAARPSSSVTIQVRTATGSAGASPATPPSPAGASASPPSGPVTVAAGIVRTDREGAVVAFLDEYFAAINAHSYARYSRLLSAQVRRQETAAKFRSGYSSTSDSGETLTGMAAAGSRLAASIAFTSHQSPASSPTGSSCTDWRTTLYLLPQGSSFLIEEPPPGYQALFTGC